MPWSGNGHVQLTYKCINIFSNLRLVFILDSFFCHEHLLYYLFDWTWPFSEDSSKKDIRFTFSILISCVDSLLVPWEVSSPFAGILSIHISCQQWLLWALALLFFASCSNYSSKILHKLPDFYISILCS